MKIAIPSADGKTIFPHFGRTQGFAILGIEDNTIKTRDLVQNNFTGHARGHHHSHSHEEGHQAHSHSGILAALNECPVVIANGMGRRLYDDLMSAGKEVFITRETDIDKAVEAYFAGNLDHDPDRSCSH
jgi:predicted Fe-Mo cluster-binding NifX family protein